MLLIKLKLRLDKNGHEIRCLSFHLGSFVEVRLFEYFESLDQINFKNKTKQIYNIYACIHF